MKGDLSSCVFCAIVDGRGPASFVHQDETVVAFMDIHPVTPGHLLVIPRAHHVALADIGPTTAAQMFTVAQRLASALRGSGIRCEGINLFYADGAAAGQEVFHAHLHVLPRYVGDGFRLAIDYDPPPSREELNAIGEQIRAAAEAL
jgi:diadenosine tetraphosphate (Ap4A) HIT family hydrolase